ncbi:MAG: bifunctional diaminohydroxyphosphoribosylaminopyrimidine deaminase/5-amino-6-(5-phosphoribosylamino)uracil reductase RibD [Acidimicrobiales bacterium]
MVSDVSYMREAIAAAEAVRRSVVPNPWVGAVGVSGDQAFVGATEPPGGRHAERVALDEAGARAAGATLYSTLEPCCHTGRTAPCTDAIIAAGVVRVVVGIEDPDEQVAGKGIAQLRAAGVSVDVGILHDEITEQLRPYLCHRRTGRPYVTLKLAATLDGRTAAPDGSSQWITGEAARADVHRLRATCDGILVGAGTVRADDPALTVRHVEGQDPRRFVLGEIPRGAKVLPAVSVSGDLTEVLDQIGAAGIVSLLVEGGATVASAFHREHLVDEYVIYLAPALFGGDNALGMFSGDAADSISSLWRGRIDEVVQLGDDLRIRVLPVDAVR